MLEAAPVRLEYSDLSVESQYKFVNFTLSGEEAVKTEKLQTLSNPTFN